MCIEKTDTGWERRQNQNVGRMGFNQKRKATKKEVSSVIVLQYKSYSHSKSCKDDFRSKPDFFLESFWIFHVLLCHKKRLCSYFLPQLHHRVGTDFSLSQRYIIPPSHPRKHFQPILKRIITSETWFYFNYARWSFPIWITKWNN